MGLGYADITLRNAREPQLRPVVVRALVDSGATHLCIPERVAAQLALPTLEQRPVTTADDRTEMRAYVGPIEVMFENRRSFTGAMVLGDEALLGAIPMEDMDVLVHPKLQKLVVNPEHPNFPHALAKGLRT